MADERPNILLIMTDQQRGDALGLEHHPVLQTPYLDHLGASGLHFRHAYSACPQCIPARRTLMSGRSAHGHGVYNNHAAPMPFPTLAQELTRAGYHTHLCGKLHLHPQRKLYGFMSADWADAPHVNGGGADWTGDYGRWLRDQGCGDFEFGMAHGADCNGWAARPWHTDERLHFTNWSTEMALRFYQRRDPTTPFFLKVSYHQPHQPCTPPQAYWDRYIDAELPPVVEAEWSTKQDGYEPGLPVSSWQTVLGERQMQQFRAGYYGCINHIDDQIGRLLRWTPPNTVVLFCSDHGEMLGDHQWIRKARALEPSIRVPFLMKFPESTGIDQGRRIDAPVELMDVMPTLLDCAGVAIPDTVEGTSLLPHLRGESDWRERVHGEMGGMGGENSGMQFLTAGNRKYIWEPGLDRELFFDLDQDPEERHPIPIDGERASEIDDFRQDLIRRLEGRPEGFVEDGKLVPLPGKTRAAADPLPTP